jgi:hypothetical protein
MVWRNTSIGPTPSWVSTGMATAAAAAAAPPRQELKSDSFDERWHFLAMAAPTAAAAASSRSCADTRRLLRTERGRIDDAARVVPTRESSRTRPRPMERRHDVRGSVKEDALRLRDSASVIIEALLDMLRCFVTNKK